jgi:hypothetical protein
MLSTMHWRPNSLDPAVMIGVADRHRVDADLLGAGGEDGVHVLEVAHAPADGERHEDVVRTARTVSRSALRRSGLA